jgi:transcriptional regulator with XRE-family HTH domain
VDEPVRSIDEWQAALGQQVKTARLDAHLGQEEVARLADLSLSAVKNLEAGRGSTLDTLIRVLRALDATWWLESLAPDRAFSPIRALESGGRAHVRQRVAPRRRREP